MALIKELTLPSGHTCSYWKIISLSRDFLQGTGMIRVAGFLDQEAREENKPMLADSIKVYEGFAGNSLEEAYTWLKERFSLITQPPISNPEYNPEDPLSSPTINQGPMKIPGEFYEAKDV